MTRVRIAREVLAVIFAALHVCATIALGEVFAGMGQPFKASRYLAVIEIDSVHYFGLVCCLVSVYSAQAPKAKRAAVTSAKRSSRRRRDMGMDRAC